MSKKQIIIFAALLLFALFFVFDRAYAQTEDKLFLLHLYYGNNKITLDRDFDLPYSIVNYSDIADPDIDEEDLNPDQVDTGRSDYTLEILAPNGSKLTSFVFDPRYGIGSDGKVRLIVAYYPNAKDINIYTAKGEQVLSIPIIQASQCNQNKVCESDLGESWFTCLADCPAPNGSVQPTEPEPESGAGSIIGAILYIVGGLALAFVAWVIYRSRRNNQASGV